jgi:hypothetical protein
MNGTKEAKLTKNIAFRVTGEEYAQIEKIAMAVGEDPNNWCRNIIVAESRDGSGLTKTERLLYEEIARVRFLVGHGFKLLIGSDEPVAATWRRIKAQVDQKADLIADDLLSRRQ